MNLPYPNPTAAQLEDFFKRVLAGLPDSLEIRKADLAILVKYLPACAGRTAASEILAALRVAEKAQKEFCFEKPVPSNDGHHDGEDGQ